MDVFKKILNKKGISPVVATALLLVVAVMAVVGFQGWFSEFSSGVFVNVESQTSFSGAISVEGIISNKLYLNSKFNSSISSISINGIDCNFNDSISGLESVDVSSCIENMSGSANIVVIAGDKVIESYKYIDKPSVSGLSIVSSDSLCYELSYVGTVGVWNGCNGMLIVNKSMLDFAVTNNPINSGEDYYLEFLGINYTFGNSVNNIFTGQVTSLDSLFFYKGNFNSSINYWDVSNVESMVNTFFGAASFNFPLNYWDTSSVVNMSSMFYSAS